MSVEPSQSDVADGTGAGYIGDGDCLAEGTRIGRFVVLRDLDGRTHAVAAGAVSALCETDDGALLMLPGGKMIHVPRPMEVILAWLDGRG